MLIHFGITQSRLSKVAQSSMVARALHLALHPTQEEGRRMQEEGCRKKDAKG